MIPIWLEGSEGGLHLACLTNALLSSKGAVCSTTSRVLLKFKTKQHALLPLAREKCRYESGRMATLQSVGPNAIQEVLKFHHTADVCRFAVIAKWTYALTSSQQVWLDRLAHNLSRETLLPPNEVHGHLQRYLSQAYDVAQVFSVPKFLYLKRSLEIRAKNV